MITPHMIANAAHSAHLDEICVPAPTAMSSLTIYGSRQLTALTPTIYEPRFYLLLQGAKRMVIAGHDFVMQPGNCAVSTLGLPFHTAVIKASPTEPYLGVAFTLDAAVVSDILLTRPPEEDDDGGSAFASGRAPEDVLDPIARLLALLRTPHDIPALAPLFERELTYRLMQGPLGGTLRMAARSHTRFEQVRAAAEWIRAHADEPMRVDALASQVGMSATSFHRHFRAVTGTSPLAYQRHIRLLAARERIIACSETVTAAAFSSGYANASQFSREYKQMFGVTPRHDSAGYCYTG